MHRFFALSVTVLAILCAGCAPERDGPDPGDCSEDLPSTAARVLVTDLTGAPTVPTSVRFHVNDGPEQDAFCADEDDCTEWVTGYDDEAGEYTITVLLNEPFPNDPWCYYWAEETVVIEVAQGTCNLATEEIDVELDVAVICQDGDGFDPGEPDEPDEPEDDDGE